MEKEKYSVSLRNQFEWGEIRSRKTPNTDTFHAVYRSVFNTLSFNYDGASIAKFSERQKAI